MTSISASKNLFLGLVLLILISGASADYYYSDSGDYSSITDDTGFSAPQYESQQEVVTQLVAPFIFVGILLQILFNRALRFAFVDEDSGNDLLGLVEDNKPNLRRESMIMSITATAILVPTPFWGYVILATASIPTIAVSLVALLFAYGAYKVISSVVG